MNGMGSVDEYMEFGQADGMINTILFPVLIWAGWVCAFECLQKKNCL